MTEYIMRMHNEHFQKIKNGLKTIEIRLNDDKRKFIKKGDRIIFTNRKDYEKIVSEVISVYRNKNFNELLKMFNISKTGHESVEEIKNALKEFYAKDMEEKNGVAGIEIKII